MPRVFLLGWALVAGIAVAPAARGQFDEPALLKTIRGIVLDRVGHPVSGARVFIYATGNRQTRTLRTDGSGRYQVNGLPGNTDYQVRVSFGGVDSPARVVTSFLAREDNVVNFDLDILLEADGEGEGAISVTTFDGVTLSGALDLPPGVQAPIPVVLLLHGYGEDRNVWSALDERLLGGGWAVVRVDLRGHGQSTRRGPQVVLPQESWRTDPQQFPLDLDPILDWIRTRPRLNSSRIAVVGSDIGAGLALIAGGRYREVGTVVALDPDLDEALAMAGTARDFAPENAEIIVADEGAGRRIQQYVRGASRVVVPDPPPPAGDTAAWIGAGDTIDQILEWLRDTY